DLLVVEEARAEIEARELANHLDEAHVRRLVEAVELLDLLDLRGIHALAAAIAADPGRARRCGGGFASAFTALQLIDELLDRPARHELDDDERDKEAPEERRDHEHQPREDV